MPELVTTATLAAPWRDASDAPPSFPECGGCFRRLAADEVFGSESQPPYGYCADCDTFTTWPATRRGARPRQETLSTVADPSHKSGQTA